MKVHLSKARNSIVLQARAEGGGTVGDLVIEIGPGESALGKSYDDWRALPDGAHEIN